MPDKHEVGGSSPLGPTKHRKVRRTKRNRVISTYPSVVEFGPTKHPSDAKGKRSLKTE